MKYVIITLASLFLVACDSAKQKPLELNASTPIEVEVTRRIADQAIANARKAAKDAENANKEAAKARANAEAAIARAEEVQRNLIK